MLCYARCLSGAAGLGRVICDSGASWASGSDNIACCIFFLSVLLLLFSSPFAILLNSFYPNPQVLPFPSDSPPLPTRAGEEWESSCLVLCCQLGLNHDNLLLYCKYCNLQVDPKFLKNHTWGETEECHGVCRVHVSTNLKRMLCWFSCALMNWAFKPKCNFVCCIYFTIRFQIKMCCHILYK